MRYVRDQYFMGWNSAPPTVWSQLMGPILTKDDVKKSLSNLYKKYNPIWSLDQRFLVSKLRTFDNKKTIQNLDLYTIAILDNTIKKAGLFAENKKKPHTIINNLNNIEKNQFISAGTSTARYFNEELLNKVINHFFI